MDPRTTDPDSRAAPSGHREAERAGEPEGEALTAVLRWERAGGHWRVVSRAHGAVTLALRTCDGGEEMERVTSADAGLLAHVGDRDASDD